MPIRSALVVSAVVGSATSLLLLAAPAATTESKPPKAFTAAQRKWWAFQPLANPAVPAPKNSAWAKTEIDRFVLATLEEKGISPSAAAGKTVLLRRAYLDLTGLPPTPEQVQAFLADKSPKAFEEVVDGLLASPHYGERWARHWLDVARYADSEGFKADETRPNIWRYRDYVIKSFNDDKPYTRFVQEQIAGDEMFPADPAALVATGFNRHFPDESNAANIEQRRQELLNDITDVVGSTFMGMTYGCARCHDHKFDPILQKDYYRLQAFFANTKIADDLNLVSADRRAAFESKNAVWLAKTESIREQIEQILKPAREARFKDRLSRFPEDIQGIITMAPGERNAFQWQMYHKAKTQVTFTDEEVAGLLKGDKKARYQALKKELAAFDSIKPKPLPVAQGMTDNGAEAPKTHILSAGAYTAKLDEVRPGFLSILDPADATIDPLPNSSGRRTVLAKWLTDPSNPLTFRVIVNRVWHHHFGRGISGSPSDFGAMGERPANKELLDWLTATFIQDGYSLKKLHKRILLSAAWQQSSDFRADAAQLDPDNKLLWRYNRHRLEGEAIRDSMLSVAGVLNPKMFGPGVFPPLPPGMTTRGGWKLNETPEQATRRSVYIFVRRNTRYPMIESFDMPDTHEPCARRNNTVSSTQALELLNNELVVDWSRSFAARVSNDSGLTRQSQIERAYKLAYSRPPSAEESKAAAAFLERHSRIVNDPKAVMADFCHALLNSNEFVYIN
ncbi:MAG: DUF1553 domain-containing protein [Bryobacterales bacterium]|nr:DUF1553 domain-containing protein [Bryobacterales bacterium]